jgi:outer membrane protein
MNIKQIGEISFKIAVVVALAVVIFKQLDSDRRIVYVDSMKLVSQYEGMKAARQELEAKVSVWKSNVDSLKAELEQKIAVYEKGKGKMSATERNLTEELLTTKQEQFMNYQQVIEEKIRKEDQELTNKVLSKVNDYIKNYGRDKGYEIIMAATQVGNIVYAKEGNDITDEIVKGLNNEFK